MENSQIHPANRVFQLEANELDNELNNTVDQLVDELGLSSLSDELRFILKGYLSLNHITRNATVGMKLYGMKFCEVDQNNGYVLAKRYKLILLSLCNVIASYMVKRHHKLEKIVDNGLSRSLKLEWLTVDNARLLLRVFNIINFLIFLRKGKHISLVGNLFGLIVGMPTDLYYSGVVFNKYQMEYMYRETIWKAIADLLTTTVPYINIGKLRNRFNSIIHKSKEADNTKLQDVISRGKNMNQCAICEKQPFNPYMIGCKHVFCYYCLHATYLSDPATGFNCNKCNYSTKDTSLIRQPNLNRLSHNSRRGDVPTQT